MRTFEYLKPTSIREAIDLLGKCGHEAMIIAGGTDLMVQWKKLVSPKCLMPVRNIADMNFIMDYRQGNNGKT
ncbi:MAG: FAD binding domain-containing protein [Desulfomonilaceae bacterium]